jgi:hypothetical protein
VSHQIPAFLDRGEEIFSFRKATDVFSFVRLPRDCNRYNCWTPKPVVTSGRTAGFRHGKFGAESVFGFTELGEGARISSIHVSTAEKLTDVGNSATFYSVLVEVELTKPKISG